MRYATVLAVVCATVGGCFSIVGSVVSLSPDYAQLPVEDLRQVANEIEEAVATGNRAPQIADRAGIVVNDETIMQAIRTRAARSEYTRKLLDGGHAWERRDGQLWIIRDNAYKVATSRKERDMNAQAVTDEATNRWAIYEGLVKASHFPPRSLSAVQAVFFEARVARLGPGHKYESENGQVVAKGSEPTS